MGTVLYIKSNQQEKNILHLVKSAIESEIAKLKLALELANKRLLSFEKKHKVTSKKLNVRHCKL